jgi:hypothetical protein
MFGRVSLWLGEVRCCRRSGIAGGMGALRAELGGGGQFGSAVYACACQRRCAFLAELRAGAILVLTSVTIHSFTLKVNSVLVALFASVRPFE